MGKRTKVPAALHSELSEYSSLIRALRTTNALDLTAQLTSSSLPASVAETRYEDDDIPDDDLQEPIQNDDNEHVNPATEDVDDSERTEEDSAGAEEANVRKQERKIQRQAFKAKMPKDTWTRWPLLAGDVHIPEWTFEDEVRLLAERSVRNTSLNPEVEQQSSAEETADPTTLSGDVEAARKPDSCDPDDGDNLADVLLTEYALDGLTASTGRYLSQVLALLASYVPVGEKSMQNRVQPINWESVLNIAAVNGLVQPEALATLRGRLSSIYPTTHPTVHDHVCPKTSGKRRSADLSFLTIEGHEPETPPQKRRRGPYKKRELGVPRMSPSHDHNSALK